MKNNILETIVEKAKREKRCVNIFAHKNPDGDAIASSKTLESFFTDNGIQARYIVTSPRVNNRFSNIVGPTETFKQRVSRADISVILDTSTFEHVENRLFTYSNRENIFVIDHHKPDPQNVIEKRLNLPSQNVCRDQTVSSTCEILTERLNEIGALNKKYATGLVIGLWTDTSKFRRFNDRTFENLTTLLDAGADYETVKKCIDAKRYLKTEVGVAKALLHTKRIKIGDTYLNYLGLDNSMRTETEQKYGVRDIQKRIFRLMEVENTALAVAVVENMPNNFLCEFRSSGSIGNVDVFSVATSLGGGGHYNASGCIVTSNKGIDSVSRDLLTRVTNQGLPSLVGLNPEDDEKTDIDVELARILDKMDRFNKDLTPENFRRIQELVASGANYQREYENKIPFERFMIRNELLAQIPEEQLEQWRINFKLKNSFLQDMQNKYGASEEDVLREIEMFKDLKVEFVSIATPTGKVASIDENGNIRKTTLEETVK